MQEESKLLASLLLQLLTCNKGTAMMAKELFLQPHLSPTTEKLKSSGKALSANSMSAVGSWPSLKRGMATLQAVGWLLRTGDCKEGPARSSLRAEGLIWQPGLLVLFLTWPLPPGAPQAEAPGPKGLLLACWWSLPTLSSCLSGRAEGARGPCRVCAFRDATQGNWPCWGGTRAQPEPLRPPWSTALCPLWRGYQLPVSCGTG